ncbi:heterokaryon incompatibility Het-C [Podospora australis]|uniref:Heterokaryon incompatibility Het-C n=1 Tax=Podospora australis TaxID=1536484 RepID=A0AAN7AJD6_9PEZI|nr:heterokaryon incompatibility Het-C [Podospora australis]
MAGLRIGWGSTLLVLAVILIVLPGQAAAFGAGNIPSIAQVEGHNWRHGDIEDTLKDIAFLYGKKWTTMLVARVYFGNWLRDYSQAVDVGSLKGVNAATIRILVWVLSFMANGYATEEFEVTEERLGCYRPEEHIDNPMGYADGDDARKYDQRLRGPVDPRELEVDPRTGMKNYIANEKGGWATSAGYLRWSFARSIHYGRMYTSGSQRKGDEKDLCEALRCLGQALHTMEDFSAHSNYCELALIELGYNNVFPHCGTATQINLNGKRVYPLVTGTFGAVDFLHSVLGEATDAFTQSEVDEVDIALKNAEVASNSTGNRGFLGSSDGPDLISLLGQLPSVGDGFASQARSLKAASQAQEQLNRSGGSMNRDGNVNIVPGMSPNFDPVKTAGQIYPILEFRDKIVRSINGFISKVPGLESLLESITERLTAFILGLLAPFVRPIIQQGSKVLKEGSSGLIETSANSQLEPWTNPRCDNPTHSMLSKDHFTNILNSCAGRVSVAIVQYVVPRILFAWENPGVPVEEVCNDVLRAFHHPAARDERVQIQRDMFEVVRKWTQETKHRHELNQLLSSESVKNHKNHVLSSEAAASGQRSLNVNHGGNGCDHGHGRPKGSLWDTVKATGLEAQQSQQHPQGGSRPNYYPQSSPRPGSSGYGAARPGSSGGYGGGGAAASYGRPSPQPQGYPGQPSYGAQHQQPPYGGGGGYGGHHQPPAHHQQQGGYGGYPGQQQQPPHHQQGGQPPYGSQPPQWGQYPRY